MYSDNLVAFAQAMLAHCAERRIPLPTMGQLARLMRMFAGDADAAAEALHQSNAAIAIGQVMRGNQYPRRTSRSGAGRTSRGSSSPRSGSSRTSSRRRTRAR